MFVDTGFASKSGLGTPMYSRRGKSTINTYLCFSRDPEEMARRRKELLRQREERINLTGHRSAVEELTSKMLRLEEEIKKKETN